MKLGPADRSLLYCHFRPQLRRVGRGKYRSSSADIERMTAARAWEVHSRLKYFEWAVPKDFRKRDSLIALALWQSRQIAFKKASATDVGPTIPGMCLTAEEAGNLILNHPRIARLFSRLERSKRRQRHPQLEALSQVKFALLKYGQRCAQFGLGVEFGRAWHSVAEIRTIVGSPARLASDKFLRDTLREYHIPFLDARGRCAPTRGGRDLSS